MNNNIKNLLTDFNEDYTNEFFKLNDPSQDALLDRLGLCYDDQIIFKKLLKNKYKGFTPRSVIDEPKTVQSSPTTISYVENPAPKFNYYDQDLGLGSTTDYGRKSNR